jgi:hypothetical protein
LEITGFSLRPKGEQSLSIGFDIDAKPTDEWRTTPMMTLHAQIIKKNGKKEYAVLPYEEFLKVREELEDYEDLRCLREAREAERNAPTIGIAELRRKIKRRTSS